MNREGSAPDESLGVLGNLRCDPPAQGFLFFRHGRLRAASDFEDPGGLASENTSVGSYPTPRDAAGQKFLTKF